MADKKITALTGLGTSLAGEDIFHVIDSPGATPVNKSIKAEEIFQQIPSFIAFPTGQQTQQTASGTVDVTTAITRFTTSSAGGYTATMPDGNKLGQIKILVFESITGSNNDTIAPTSGNINGVTNNIVLDAAGECLILMYLPVGSDNKWHILANPAQATIS